MPSIFVSGRWKPAQVPPTTSWTGHTQIWTPPPFSGKSKNRKDSAWKGAVRIFGFFGAISQSGVYRTNPNTTQPARTEEHLLLLLQKGEIARSLEIDGKIFLPLTRSLKLASSSSSSRIVLVSSRITRRMSRKKRIAERIGQKPEPGVLPQKGEIARSVEIDGKNCWPLSALKCPTG